MTHSNRRWTLALATVALAAVALLGAGAAGAQNLVPNGNFSQGTAHWHWHGLSGVENCCAGGFPAGAYPEAYAHPNGAGGSGLGGYIVPWVNIPGPASGSYRLSGYVRTSGGAQQAWIQADNGIFENRYCKTATTNVTGWTHFFCDFNFSGGTLHVALVASNAPATAWGWVVWDSISLVRTGGDTYYDLALYMGRTSGNGPIYTFTSGEKMQVQSATLPTGMAGFYQVKNSQWEEIGYDASYIYRLRDTSPGGGQFYALYRGCPGACTLGSRWVWRFMRVGDTFWRGDNQVRFFDKSSCTMTADFPQASGIKLVAHYPSININGHNLGDVVHLVSYHDGNYTNPWEEYYYARGIGLVKWRDVASGLTFQYNGPASGAPSRESVCLP